MTVNAMRDHFRAIGEFLDEDERELVAEAAALTPSERLESSLRLSQALLDDYARLLAQPGFAAEEDRRAWQKAELHKVWRARRGLAR